MPGSKCAFRRDETAIFASAPRTWRVAAPLASSGRFLPCSKTKKNAMASRSTSSPVSGRCAKTPHVRFVLCFTAQTGLRPQNPRVFIGFREAVPGPPKRPPKRLPGARASRRPPRGLQEASKSPPRRPRCVCYCVLQSKLASGLKNLRFFNGFRAPKRPQVRFLLCFTDQTCLRS